MNPSLLLLLLLFQVDSLGYGLRPQVQRRRRRVAPLRGIPRGRRGRRAAVPLVAARRGKRLRPREGERGERRVEDGGVVDGHAVGVVAGGGGRTEHGHHSVAPAKFVC